MTMWGFALYAIGSAICCFAPSNMAVVLTGQFIKNVGGLPSAYVFMALFADVLDHVEWKSGIRCDGTAMSIYNIIAVAMVGICTGIFNWMLASAGYIAPAIDVAGNTIAAVQNDGVLGAITFAFVGLEIITGAILVGLLIFLNVEKTITRKQEAIRAYRKAECEAAGQIWIDPDIAAAQEQARQDLETEKAYLAELKIKCERNGWDYDQKAEEYRQKISAAKAKAEQKRAQSEQKELQKAERIQAKQAAKQLRMSAEALAAKAAKEEARAAATEKLWQKEQIAGGAYREKIQLELARQ